MGCYGRSLHLWRLPSCCSGCSGMTWAASRRSHQSASSRSSSNRSLSPSSPLRRSLFEVRSCLQRHRCHHHVPRAATATVRARDIWQRPRERRTCGPQATAAETGCVARCTAGVREATSPASVRRSRGYPVRANGTGSATSCTVRGRRNNARLGNEPMHSRQQARSTATM